MLTNRRTGWLFWLSLLAFSIALALFPVSYRTTRMVVLALGFLLWLGFFVLAWKRRALRWSVLVATVLAGGFLLLPARRAPPIEPLRTSYLAALQRYEGVKYYWGGENARGIDCSGLIRRGLIDAHLRRGVETFDPGEVRRAIALWWNDCTASALGEGHQGLTVPVAATASLNALDHTQILPGDRAVTQSGIHILSYLGERRWIEADPAVGKVIIVTAPSADNLWFQGPMKIVRWRALE